MDFISAALLLFLTMDPLGNIPVYLSVLESVAPERCLRVVMRELVLALLIMIGFLYVGEPVLKVLELSAESISIAGGIILFLIALKMVFPLPRAAHAEDDLDGEPFIVPLAVPLVAGPSTLAILVLLVSREPGQQQVWLMALLAAWFVSAIILAAATKLKRLLGKRGLIAMERLMGLVLVALSVQMFLDGLRSYLAS